MTDNKLSKSEDEAFYVDLQEANTHRTLESEVKIRTSAMETYEDTNSSLIAANISLQVTDSVFSSVLVWFLWGESSGSVDM